MASEAVRDDCMASVDLAAALNNYSGMPAGYQAEAVPELSRIGDLPAMFSDIIVRRAPSLQKTRWASSPVVHLPTAQFEALGLKEGSKIQVIQENGQQVLPVKADRTLPGNCIRLASGHPDTAMLGPIDGWVKVERL